MSDNQSVRSLGDLLASLSPPPHAVIDLAAQEAANGAEIDNVAAFMMRHTTVDYIPVMDECPICLESFAVEPCVRITGIEGCNHQIGQDCLEQMLRNRPNEEKRCPLCRAVWIPGQGGNSPQLIAPPRAPSPVNNDSDFEEIEDGQAIEDIRAGRLNRLNRLNASAAGSNNNAGRSAFTNNSSQPSSNTPETAIVLDSDSDDDDYETQRRNYESFARDIQDVRSRARQTQLSRSERRQAERSQRRREERERSQSQREGREDSHYHQTRGHEKARGRSRSLSGNGRHTSPSALRSDSTDAPAPSGVFASLNPSRSAATGRVDGVRNWAICRGVRGGRAGMRFMRARGASPPRRGATQTARNTSPPQVASPHPPRRSSLHLPPGFAAPGSIAPSHAMMPGSNYSANRLSGQVQVELAQVELRAVEMNHRERALNEREHDLDRREHDLREGEQRITEWEQMMARHQAELRELLERHQQEIERATV